MVIMQKRIITFCIFNESHIAKNTSNMIKEILHEYDLVNKIFSIDFDNATNNTASIRDLKNYCEPQVCHKFFHIRCACHSLNLSVQDGLRTLNPLIEPIMDAISYQIGHPKIMKE
ncbi:hypothetical protein ACH5RR_008590 [Cinchona calisaya]|uniref:DUF4371 domain-containing protein n=1 Tax=Cinchona calisaya TaxID=153742 RepID=A0ABD3ADQ2_9GENT